MKNGMLFVIEQVLSNALKYTKRGNHLHFNWKNHRLYASPIPESVSPRRICPGFLKKALPVLTAERTKRHPESDCICADASAKNLGHRITAESILDEGTTIRIYLEREALEVE